MNVYMYKADLWCEDCGGEIRERLTAEGKAPDDPEDEVSYDSDDFPKGPYPDGGGEADCPNHCAAGADCINAEYPTNGMFLENPLTSEGYDYVREAVAEKKVNGRWVGGSHVARMWAKHYDINVDED